MPGTGKKVLMWLGLADAEEYDEYEPYEEVPAPQVAPRRGGEVLEAAPQTSPAVRTLPRDGQDAGPINLRPAPDAAAAVAHAGTDGQGARGVARPSSPTPRR